MKNLPPPPVPEVLQKMLKDYPDCIERLQLSLNDYMKNPYLKDLFRGAIFALQSEIEKLSKKSIDDIAIGKKNGDMSIIESASKKYSLLSNAGWFVFEMMDMDDLWAYFQASKEGFK